MYYDETYVNPRKRPANYRKPAARKPVSPAMRKNYRRLALLEAQNEIVLAERANRRGNHKAARMILDSVKGKLALAEGRTYTPAPRRADARLSDVELRNTRRQLELIQASQN